MKQITIKTPENIDFTYELAGVGSRFLAIVVDSLIKSGAIMLVIGTLTIIGNSIHLNIFGGAVSYLKSSLTISILFFGALAGFIMIGYYVFFEALWNGQTPGKRILGLRVIKENGASISIIESVIRNFLRVADFMPSFYILGAITILANAGCKRLGDFAAGTLVVKIASEFVPVLIPEMEVETPLQPVSMSRLEEADYHLVRNFIIRRNELKSDVRHRLSGIIAGGIKELLEPAGNPFSADEELLEWIVAEYGKRK